MDDRRIPLSCALWREEKWARPNRETFSGRNLGDTEENPSVSPNANTTPHPRKGVSLFLSLIMNHRQVSQLRDQLIAAADDPRLAELDIDPGWCLALAGHLTALTNGWLER